MRALPPFLPTEKIKNRPHGSVSLLAHQRPAHESILITMGQATKLGPWIIASTY